MNDNTLPRSPWRAGGRHRRGESQMIDIVLVATRSFKRTGEGWSYRRAAWAFDVSLILVSCLRFSAGFRHFLLELESSEGSGT